MMHPLRQNRLPLFAIATTFSLLAGCGPRPQMPTASRVEELAAESRRNFPQVPSMTVADCLKRRERGRCILVDVRTPEERAVSVIPGSIAADAFEANRDLYRGKAVVVYCTIGWRSAKYVAELRKQGIDALNLTTGVLGWALAGQEFVTPQGDKTRRVHVYHEKWNALPQGYDAVW